MRTSQWRSFAVAAFILCLATVSQSQSINGTDHRMQRILPLAFAPPSY